MLKVEQVSPTPALLACTDAVARLQLSAASGDGKGDGDDRKTHMDALNLLESHGDQVLLPSDTPGSTH